VDRVPVLVAERKRLTREVQALQQQQNELQKATGKEKDAEKRQALIEQGRGLRTTVAELEGQFKLREEELRDVLRTIPNMSHPEAPVGTTAEANRVLKKWRE